MEAMAIILSADLSDAIPVREMYLHNGSLGSMVWRVHYYWRRKDGHYELC